MICYSFNSLKAMIVQTNANHCKELALTVNNIKDSKLSLLSCYYD